MPQSVLPAEMAGVDCHDSALQLVGDLVAYDDSIWLVWGGPGELNCCQAGSHIQSVDWAIGREGVDSTLSSS